MMAETFQAAKRCRRVARHTFRGVSPGDPGELRKLPGNCPSVAPGAGSRPEFGQFWPIWAMAHVGQHSANIGRIWPKLAACWTQLAEVVQQLAQIEQDRSSLGRISLRGAKVDQLLVGTLEFAGVVGGCLPGCLASNCSAVLHSCFNQERPLKGDRHHEMSPAIGNFIGEGRMSSIPAMFGTFQSVLCPEHVRGGYFRTSYAQMAIHT